MKSASQEFHYRLTRSAAFGAACAAALALLGLLVSFIFPNTTRAELIGMPLLTGFIFAAWMYSAIHNAQRKDRAEFIAQTRHQKG